MLAIVSITGPIYLAIALGYVCTRAGLFARADMRVLGKFVLYVALPALLFNALSKRNVREIVEWRYLAVYALGSLATIGLGLLWARCLARRDATASVYDAMGMSCPNSGFVGYPIMLLMLGPVAGVILGLNMVVENLLLLPLLMALAEAASGGGHWRAVLRTTLRGLARNPMVIGIAVGVAVALLRIPVPAPIDRTVTMVANASAALSLFFIGGSLAGLQLKGMGAQVAQIAVGKLIVHPLLIFGALHLIEALGVPPMDPVLRTGVVLTAASPMLGIYPILAQRHGHEGLAAATLLGTTFASFFTISAVLWALGGVPVAG